MEKYKLLIFICILVLTAGNMQLDLKPAKK